MPTRKQKNRKNRERGPDGRFIRKELARTPSLEAGPSSASASAPPLPKPFPTTPNTSTVPTSPPRAPQPTRTRPRTATPPLATPLPATPPLATPPLATPPLVTPLLATPPRLATWNYREPIQDESPISEDLLLRQLSLPRHPTYSSPIRS
jgi:hypothetical protein